MGIEDIAVASRIYRVAEEAGIGQRVVLWQNPVWS
jgi:ornithine cyclodeaminase/alanine dehydrogenase-like protein (mu-crystallin family)